LDAGEGFAPPMIRAYETGLLASLPAIFLVQPTGIEPVSMALQTTAMTTSAKVAYFASRVIKFTRILSGLKYCITTCFATSTSYSLQLNTSKYAVPSNSMK
jgi:hypothetical protein